MNQQEQLLLELLAFYKRRYGGEYESKFNSACEDLITAGDVEKTTYLAFCLKNDIEPNLKLKKEPPRRYSQSHC